MTNISQHVKYMQMCVALAQQAGTDNPLNLKVGCLIVKNNQVIASGYFDAKKSSHHAEVHAFNSLTRCAKGSTVYVNLEPCFHTGKTPPCVNLLIKHQVAQVVIPFADPNPLVSGQSIKLLRSQGIKVVTGILAEQCWQLNELFLHYYLLRQPLVTAKWASSLDGKLCTHTKDSKWISSAQGRKKAHWLRSQHQAILVGANTIRYDNPKLNVRHYKTNNLQPIKIIILNSGVLPLNAQIWQEGKNLLVIPSNYPHLDLLYRLEQMGVTILPVNHNSNDVKNNDISLNFCAILQEIAKQQIYSVLIEGGAHTLGEAFRNRVVTKVEMFTAPLILGGSNAVANFVDQRFNLVHQADKFKFYHHQILQDTIWLRALSSKYLKHKYTFLYKHKACYL